MRPLPGSEAHPSAAKPRSRKSSVDHAAAPSSHIPTAFFMKREEDLDKSLATYSSTDLAERSQDSNFGVQSLADTLEAAFGQHQSTPKVRTKSGTSMVASGTADSRSTSQSPSSEPARPLDPSKPPSTRKVRPKLATHASMVPSTKAKNDAPSSIPPSAMPSTPTSVSLHSLKLSDEDSALDEVASQAIASSSEEEEDAEMPQGASSSFPQLVMPRIQMPTRRPFTTKGKAMGKLKVMVAGQRGIGKTSLIRSILQLCEHIVHVDPVSTSHPSDRATQTESKAGKQKKVQANTMQITEIHASTKPCPHWWSDVEEKRAPRRRKSSHDMVLERNICFVDTPGFSENENMDSVINYLESLFCQTSSAHTLGDSEILGLVSGAGGVSVDVVFYLLSPDQDMSKDMEFMRRLSTLTNVIPVIGKSDTLSVEEIISLKTSVLTRLQTTPIRPFLFGKALDDALLAVQSLSLINAIPAPDMPSETSFEASRYPFATPTYPYALSSTPGSNNDTMDASLLMSPGYIQPLLPSELLTLVDQVFDPDSIAWLRHSAAKKYLAWRRKTRLPGDSLATESVHHRRSPRRSSIGLTRIGMNSSATSSILTPSSPSGVLVPSSESPFYASNLASPTLDSPFSLANSEAFDCPADFSLTRFRNHAGEQHLAEVRISRWAMDLQRSLRNERDRFEELQRNDRAKWLLERVEEEVSRGTIITSPGGSPRAGWAVVRHGNDKAAKAKQQRFKKAACLDSRDPLGLCDLSDEVKRRGFVLVKIFGGMSVLGAVIVGVLRASGVETTVLPQNGWWSFVTDWLAGSNAD